MFVINDFLKSGPMLRLLSRRSSLGCLFLSITVAPVQAVSELVQRCAGAGLCAIACASGLRARSLLKEESKLVYVCGDTAGLMRERRKLDIKICKFGALSMVCGVGAIFGLRLLVGPEGYVDYFLVNQFVRLATH